MGQHSGTPSGRGETLTVGSGLGSLGAEPGTALALQIPVPPGTARASQRLFVCKVFRVVLRKGWQSSAPSGSGQGLNNKCCPDPDAPWSLCQHGVGVVTGGKGLCLCPPGAGQDSGTGCSPPCQAHAPPLSQFSVVEGQPVGFWMCLTVPAPVSQVLAPSSCTRCMRGSGAFPWTPMTSQMLWCRCRGPPWLWESTSMQVMWGWEQGRVGLGTGQRTGSMRGPSPDPPFGSALP